ncbi:MAG: nitric oxide reductase activation protein [Eubacteriales bacterium]|nr:nitric oxide reductase activation protein [Eubacteriales bacterium]
MDYDFEEHKAEIENRIRNLMWTVSGDYSLDVKPDVASFEKSKYISLYDAIKQGAFARYFDADLLAMYVVKKLYYGAEEAPLMSLAQLCVDAAAYPKIVKERPGVEQVRRKAFDAMLDHDYHRMTQSYTGRVKIAVLRDFLYQNGGGEKNITFTTERLQELAKSTDTMEIIRTIDEIYNTKLDATFEQKHGDLEHVLAVELEELAEANWQDLFKEEMYESMLEEYMEDISRKMTSLEEHGTEEKEKKKNSSKKSILVLDQEAIDKMQSYIELNFGRSYLNEIESKRLNHRLCQGAHADCSLYYTEGILENPVLSNAQYVNAKRQAEFNRKLCRTSKNMVKRNVDILTANLRRSLVIRMEKDEIPSEFGTIVPFRLWKVGRTDPGKMFTRVIRQNNSEFVVDILMDASGSQRDRQSQVALQAFIISEALSNVGIPHRVMSFCSFWDYTVMQRFREYDAPKSENRRILNYTTSSNNRDGLAIRAAGDSLLQREEENRILIVLSDGRPNDVIVNRPGSRNPRSYCGDYAVMDTALEVRKLRNDGVFVLGVFAGLEEDLEAEKKIFGKDFAYIHDIRNFSNVVGQYLQRLLDW